MMGGRLAPGRVRELLRMYLVIGSVNCAAEPLRVAEEALAGGATLVQFREKGRGALAEEARLKLALQLQAACRRAEVPFFINDDVDLALYIGANGVHIGQDDEEAGAVRARLGNGRLLGVSAHNVREAQLAVEHGADYLGIGPIYPTVSKDDAHAVQGTQIIRELRARWPDLPLVGIGGITAARTSEVVRAGADGVAVISAITGVPLGETQSATREIKSQVERNLRY